MNRLAAAVLFAAGCSADCHTSGPVCGNGSCEAGETTTSCSQDCSSSTGGPLQAGRVYWGAAGHLNWGGVYNTPLSQQIADLKTIFGNTPNTIVYRAICEHQDVAAAEADAKELRAGGILPICLIGNPNFGSFGSEKAAYDSGYNTVLAYAQTVQHANIFEIGNEWPLHGATASGHGLNPDSWRKSPNYRILLGYAAGASAAIRDKRSDAAIIAGATYGWTAIGFSIALGVDLKSYNGRDLSPDYVNLHWYNDVTGRIRMGLLENQFGNVYVQYKVVGSPIAVTEFGSSEGSTDDGNNITGLMSSFAKRAQASGSEASVAIGIIYQLYPSGGEGFQLFSSPGSISAAGQVVKNWIALHGNPSSQ